MNDGTDLVHARTLRRDAGLTTVRRWPRAVGTPRPLSQQVTPSQRRFESLKAEAEHPKSNQAGLSSRLYSIMSFNNSGDNFGHNDASCMGPTKWPRSLGLLDQKVIGSNPSGLQTDTAVRPLKKGVNPQALHGCCSLAAPFTSLRLSWRARLGLKSLFHQNTWYRFVVHDTV